MDTVLQSNCSQNARLYLAYTCDYKVIGIRDICDLDDKPFVRQRMKRDKIVTIMYFIVVFAFIFSMYFMASLLGLIL